MKSKTHQYSPPISSRESPQLLSIIENPDGWEAEAINQARVELESRGIGIEQQKNSEKSFKKYTNRKLFIKENASYSNTELVLLVLFGPVLMILLGNLFLFSTEDEFKKKKKQGWLALGLGIVLWIAVLYFSLK